MQNVYLCTYLIENKFLRHIFYCIIILHKILNLVKTLVNKKEKKVSKTIHYVNFYIFEKRILGKFYYILIRKFCTQVK